MKEMGSPRQHQGSESNCFDGTEKHNAMKKEIDSDPLWSALWSDPLWSHNQSSHPRAGGRERYAS